MYSKLTEIVFLLDRSGSMAGLEKETINGFNSFIEKQINEGETKVTTVLFDDKYEILWNGVNAKDIRLTNKEYFVRGSTALLDAIGKTIIDILYRTLQTDESNRAKNTIFVITTDGYENSSKEFTHKKIKELINNQKEKYGWEFVFLGANIESLQEASNIGIKSEDTFKFDATEAGVEKMYSVVSEAVYNRRKK